jgi:hypothetical protein
MTNRLIFKPIYNDCISFEYSSEQTTSKIIAVLNSADEFKEYEKFIESMKKNERDSFLGTNNLNISYSDGIVIFQAWNYDGTFVFTELKFKYQECIEAFEQLIEYVKQKE